VHVEIPFIIYHHHHHHQELALQWSGVVLWNTVLSRSSP